MSAQNDFAQVVAMLSSLNTISQSAHGSDANLEYLQNELFYTIRRMVSNNRRDAIRQQDAIRRARQLEQRMTAPPPPAVIQPVRVNAVVQPVRVYALPPTRYNPLEKTKVIAKYKLEETIDCAICQETPKVKDCILTECKHYFCKGCWTGWMNAERSNKSCPTCRKEMPKITSFKARASSKPAAPAPPARPVMIIEDDDFVSHMSETIDSF